tara:strand:- start:330 stop:1184 length:855 start_codon:yes stop_codon:yes gene_type:complete
MTDFPQKPLKEKLLKYIITIIVVLLAIWSASGLEISLERLSKAPKLTWTLISALYPIDLSDEALDRIIPKVFESLYIAWTGTIIGAIFSFPVAFLAAKNTSPNFRIPFLSKTKDYLLHSSQFMKQILNIIRAFPELLLAFVFLPITGLGALTGTLAIGIHSIGTLGKLSSEVIEGIDEGPLEAIKASGGSKSNELIFGVIPQVMPTIIAYWLYRFEINLRASAVLGVIGAGGVGQELINQLRFRAFDRAGTVLVATVILVLSIDTLSGALRRRIIKGKSVNIED